MRILFLTKRYYTSRDLIADHYGRLYEIPDCLSRSGHTVDLICHNYRNGPEFTAIENPNLTLSSWNLGADPVTGFWRHYRRMDEIINKSRPDIVIAASDCYQIIIGSALARKHSIPWIADLYDNFAYYKASRIPGVLPLFGRALKNVNAITAVSGTLIGLVKKKYTPAGKLHLVENAVSENFNVKRDRQVSRRHFSFEDDRIYIGTAGELSREKGVDLLVRVFAEIAEENDKLTLVLAGKKERRLNIPDGKSVRYLGLLQYNEIPALFSALDIGIVCIKDNDFGRYCFPQKFYEMAACGLPLVAADVGEMSTLLESFPGFLYRPDSSTDLKRAILQQIVNRQRLTMDVPTWKLQAEKFDRVIRDVVNK